MRLQPTPCSSRLIAACLAAAGLVLAAGCSDSTVGPDGKAVDPAVAVGLKPGQLDSLVALETTLSTDKTAAGTDVVVTCVGQPGNLQLPKPAYTVTPDAEVTITAERFQARKSGTYAVACKAGKLVDNTPAQLLVLPGPAVSITTAVGPAKIEAGAQATVSCSGKDAFGNDVGKGEGDWSATVDPVATADVAGMQATGKKAGKAQVKCKLSSSPDAPVTAAELEVVAGKAHTTVAAVTPDTIEAGADEAEVACSAEDAYGNPVEATGFTIDAPAGVTLSGKKLKSDKGGKHEITCGLPGTKEHKPAVLTVKPGKPISMTLYAKPDLPVYKVEDTIKLFGLGKDKFGNDVKDMILEQAAVDPPEGVTVNGAGKSYSFNTDGIYKFSAKSKDFPELANELTLKCDSTGPMLLITSPKRGETRDGDAKVTVQGTCLDELSAFKSLTINGQKVTVGADGSFTFDIQSVQGMNAIIWEALDEWDNKSTGVQAYYYSTKWYPTDIAKPAEAHVDDGIGFWMSQQVIDSGNHIPHTKPKDLATVAELVIGSMDLGALLGASGIPVNQPNIFVGEIKLQNIKLGDKGINEGYPQVALTVIKGGLHLNAKIHKFSADLVLDGKGAFNLPIKQTVIISAKLFAIDTDVLISLDAKTGDTKSEAKNTKVDIQDLDIKLGGLPGQLLNWLNAGWLLNLITPVIEQTLQQQIQQMIGDSLGSALKALAINQELPLKPFIGEGDEVKLLLNSKLGQLVFKENGAQSGGILVGLDGSVTAEKKVPHTVLGAIGRAACLDPKTGSVFNPSLKFGLEIGLADDFANQLLHGIWNGGLMQLTIGEKELGSVDLSQYGVSKLAVSTDFLLPPILNTCLDKDGLLKLQIGDLGVHAQLEMSGTPVDLYLYTTMQATAELKAVDNPKTGQKELGFAMKSIDFLELEVVKINAEAKGLQDLFVTMIKTVMLPKLVDSLGSGLGSFPLPAFDLSAFSAAIPKGTELAIEIQQIENELGYTYLRGKVK